tara:strand:+ start:4518 stop:5315 length:798 start_codon:yes stop_codon:yes gene_type:complete
MVWPMEKTAIITGGANGIGYSSAKQLASLGFKIALIDRDTQKLGNAVEIIQSTHNVECKSYIADVSNEDESELAYDRILAELKQPLLLFNNAGIMPRQLGPVEQLPTKNFNEMINIHLNGAFIWSKLVIPKMKECGYGRIVNMSSFMGITGSPFRLDYVTAKAGLVGMTRGLATELARFGITVNAVAPGFVLTETLKERVTNGFIDAEKISERTPVGRWATPDEISSAVAFLMSDKSSYITGHVLPIDGGTAMSLLIGENIGSLS